MAARALDDNPCRLNDLPQSHMTCVLCFFLLSECRADVLPVGATDLIIYGFHVQISQRCMEDAEHRYWFQSVPDDSHSREVHDVSQTGKGAKCEEHGHIPRHVASLAS